MDYTRKQVSRRCAPLPRLTPRALIWLEFINRHGPLPSTYLHELTKTTHRCRDTSLRQLQTLCQRGVLFRPPQQKSALYAPFNPYIYDLTNKGYDALYEHGIDPNPARPAGHFPHLLLTACVTASFEMAAAKNNADFIEAGTILAIGKATLGIPVGTGNLIPDQLFAIRTSEGYRAFALEVDRGTEPVSSGKLRKSYRASTEAYNEVLKRNLHHIHYGLKSNLIILWVFASKGRQRKFLDLLAERGGPLSAQCLTTWVDGFRDGWRPPRETFDLAGSQWVNCRGRSFSLC